MANISLGELAEKLAGKKEEQGISKAFRMDFTYVLKNEKAIIKIDNQSICRAGGVFLMIAPPGTGKSNVCEAAAAGAINPLCDALGFQVDSDSTLLVDTERTLNDLKKGLDKIKARAGVDEKEILEKLDVFSFTSLDTVDLCKSELKHLVSIKKYQLVIIDGSADFVKSVNDEEESKNFWKFIINLANQHGFGVMITIHPNPGDKDMKATGHLGSQGQKKADSVFNVFKSNDDKDVRVLTTETPHGKVRSALDKITASFKWNNNENMFMSCDGPVKRKVKNIKQMFTGDKMHYGYNELCRAWMECTGQSLTNAKRKIKDALEIGDIEKGEDGIYSLNGMDYEVRNPGMEVDPEDDLPF